MKTTIDAYLKEYTQEKMPPPWQTYTIQNQPGIGNNHVVQKVYEGDFEFDIFYTPSDAGTVPMSEDLSAKITEVRKAFDERYGETLAPKKPFAGQAALALQQESVLEFDRRHWLLLRRSSHRIAPMLLNTTRITKVFGPRPLMLVLAMSRNLKDRTNCTHLFRADRSFRADSSGTKDSISSQSLIGMQRWPCRSYSHTS